MASNIISETIDGEYPVAGVDNDTQGFRDNFSIIKNNFATAKTEIENLQENTVKLSLEPNDPPNDFKGTSLIDANLERVTEKYFPIGGLAPSQSNLEINIGNGHYQTITIDENDIELNLVGWTSVVSDSTSTRIAKITVELRNISTQEKTVTWVTRGAGSGTEIKLGPDTANPMTLDPESITIVDFWSYTGGSTVYANLVGKFQ